MSPARPAAHRVPLHEEWLGLSLLDYLCLLWPDRARRTVLSLFANGLLRERNRPVSPRVLVGEVDELTLHADPQRIPCMFSAPPDSGERTEELSVLHEDERLVVVNKPAGWSVVPDRREGSVSCLEVLTWREVRSRASKTPGDYVRLRVVHRIDRWTSGLVIFAKTPETERRLGADFESRAVRKEYRALVSGLVAPARIVVNCPIAPGRKGKMRAVGPGAPGAKAARTTFDVLDRLREATLVCAVPETGRQHQIRVHAWAMGHPLVIDPLYAVGPGRAYQGPPLENIERLTLHAYRYTLPPDWDEPRTFECPLAEDFRRALEALRKR